MTLGILRVAASLEQQGYVVEMLDLSGIENYEQAVKDHARQTEATIFGITATTPQMPAAARIAAAIRGQRPDVRIILGGPHVTLIHAALRRERKLGIEGRAERAFRKLAECFDVLVVGDGEDAIFEAIRPCPPKVVDGDNPSAGLFLTNKRYGELPFPARHLVDVGSYHYSIDGVPALSMIAQLGCPFACAFCLSGDTMLFTDNGPVRLDAYQVGESGPIASPNGRASVSAFIKQGEREVFRLTVEGGMSIKATPDHSFLCASNDALVWRRLDELSRGDSIVIRRPDRKWPIDLVSLKEPILPDVPPGGFPNKWHHVMPLVLDEKLAWLAGFVVGDGSIPTDNRPSFHVCITDGVEQRLHEIVQTCFNVEIAVSAASNTHKMRHGWVHSRLAREVLVQSLGIDPHDKHKIPSIFWQSPKVVLVAFLDGLFAADSYTEPSGNTYLVTASKQLADHVAYAILMVGRGCPTIATIKRPEGEDAFGGTGVSYRVGILNNDRIPCTKTVYQSRKSGLWYWRSGKRKNLRGIRRRTLHKSGLHHPLDRDGWYYAEVKNVEICGSEPTYDLTVPDESAFVANGFIAHNCGGRESAMLRRIRTRTTASIVGEIRHLYETYGTTGIMLYDDELNVNKQIVELMNGIADLGDELGVEWKLRGFVKSELFTAEQAKAMYRAGFRWLLVGFESGSPRILENINKKATREDNTRCLKIAHDHGIKVKALMSAGHAGESAETIAETKDWLLTNKPDDFDVSLITVYAGTPYHDHATESSPGIWTYMAKNGDVLHYREMDFNDEGGFYKGIPGDYKAFVWTDYLSSEDLVRLRDDLESDVRKRLGIAFNTGAPGARYEASMGQLPGHILRISHANSANAVT